MQTELSTHPGLLAELESRLLARAEPSGTHVNSISGSARFGGATLQARDVQGGIHLHVPASPTLPVPRQLPLAPPHFAGRRTELADLAAARRTGAGAPGPLIVVSGPAGVGKTALAAHWLRAFADEYPDGQLYADLRGYATPGAPADPTEALGAFLRAFGIGQVPAGLAEASALWRSLTGGRRLAVLLDNALTAAQVRPLLPGSPESLVVVTSRSRLSGLAIDGAVLQQLAPLGAAEATEILRSRVGAARVEAEPGAAREVVERCAGLPLALCIAAARMATRPRQPLAVTAEALGREGQRLAVLDLEGDRAVQSALDASYHCLRPAAARLYRLLGRLPFASCTAASAAAAGDLPGFESDALLDALAEVNLLEELDGGRYRFHDLVRLHARAAGEQDPEGPAAIRRTVDWYLCGCTRAEAIISPSHRNLDRDYLEGREWPAPFEDERGALGWLDSEQPQLMAAVRYAAEAGWDATTWQLVDAMWPLFLRLRPYPQWIEAHRLGLAAARRAGHRAGESRMLTSGGAGLRNGGRPHEAITWYGEALRLAEQDGDQRAAAQSLHGLGQSHHLDGRLDRATHYFRESLALREAIGYHRGAGLSRLSLGEVELSAGRPDQAVPLLERARAELAALPDPYEAARARALLGRAHTRAGRYEAAEQALTRALAEFQTCGSPHWSARVLEFLGELAQERGQFTEALRCYRQSEAAYRAASAPDTLRLTSRIAELAG